MSSDRWERLLKKLDKALKKGRRRNPRRRPRIEPLDERLMMAADVWTPRDDGPTLELFPAERPIDQSDYTTPRLDDSSRDAGPIPLVPEAGGIDQSDYTTPRQIQTSNPQLAAAQEDFGTTGGTDGSTGGTDGSTGGTDGSTGGTDGSTGGTDGSTGGTDGSTGGTDGSTGGTDGSTGVTDGSTGGTDGSTGGTDGSTGGTTGGTAGSTGGTDGSTGGTDGSTGGTDGSTGGTDGSTGGTDGSTGGTEGSTGGTTGGTDGSTGGTDGSTGGTEGSTGGTEGSTGGTGGTTGGTTGGATGGSGDGCSCDPPVNNPPTFMNTQSSASIDEDTSLTVNVLANAADPDPGQSPFVVAAEVAPYDAEGHTHGKVHFTLGTVTYVPNENWFGSDQFTYTVKDGHGGSATATVAVTVNPVNDAPVAGQDFAVVEGDSVTVPVLGNDFDPDSDAPGAVSLVSADSATYEGGTITYDSAGGTVTYHAGWGYTGWDSFSYQIEDADGAAAVHGGSVFAYVVPSDPDANSSPAGVSDRAEVFEGQSVAIPDVLANDYDVEGEAAGAFDDGLTLTDVADYSSNDAYGGTVSFTAGGEIDYAPPPNTPANHQPVTAQLYYYFADAGGYSGESYAFAYVKVKPVDDAPVAANDTAYTGFEQPVTIYVRNNDTDIEGDALIVANVTQGDNGRVTFDGHNVTYTPCATFTSGADSFTYTVKDGYGREATATVTVQMVEVTGWQLERQKLDESWVGVPNNGDGFVDAGEIVWASDPLRWTADYDASAPISHITGTDWRAKPWSDPGGYWQFTYGDPGLGAPGVGDWAVAPRIHFGNFPNQTGFVAEMHDPAPRVADAEIQKVEWKGVPDGDGQTNLTADNPAGMGGGWRIFPGKNSMAAGAPSHRAVEIKVTVTPAIQGIPVKLKLYDPDDPTYAAGPVDADPNTNDNRGDPTLFDVGQIIDATTTVTEDEFGNPVAVADRQFLVSLNPGDNFRVAAAERENYFDYIKVISSQTAPETQGRLYVDKNKNGIRDNGEPAMDENNPARRADNNKAIVFSTPLLTVWRRLHVEVDSMGPPPAGTQFDADDLPPAGPNGAVPRPDTSKLDEAFNNAFIDVDVITNTAISQSNLPFKQTLSTLDTQDPRDAWNDYFLGEDDPDDPNDPNDGDSNGIDDPDGYRQTKDEDPMYWTAYVAGVYEIFPDDPNNRNQAPFDNDPDTGAEPGALGFTNIFDGESKEYSMIPMEINRDVAEEFDWAPEEIAHVQELVTVHEIGHQFGLNHGQPDPLLPNYDEEDVFPGHVMTFPQTGPVEEQSTDVEIEFQDSDIDKLREFGSGEKP